jgi:hypothetical protein
VPEAAPAPEEFEEDDITFNYMDDLGEAPPDSAGGAGRGCLEVWKSEQLRFVFCRWVQCCGCVWADGEVLGGLFRCRLGREGLRGSALADCSGKGCGVAARHLGRKWLCMAKFGHPSRFSKVDHCISHRSGPGPCSPMLALTAGKDTSMLEQLSHPWPPHEPFCVGVVEGHEVYRMGRGATPISIELAMFRIDVPMLLPTIYYLCSSPALDRMSWSLQTLLTPFYPHPPAHPPTNQPTHLRTTACD